jgi:hypothetical protein
MCNVLLFVIGVFDALFLFVVFNFQSELTVKCHEVIALKSEVRDLLQKLESKERRIQELEGKRPERCVDGVADDNTCDKLAEDKFYSIVGRLNEQVRRVINIRYFVYTCTRIDVAVHRYLIIFYLFRLLYYFQKFSSLSPVHPTCSPHPLLTIITNDSDPVTFFLPALDLVLI